MSLKRRILKWGVIGLLVLVFALWFGFTTFFFNPLEDDFEHDVSTLVPRNVDFFVAKADLEDDLDSDLMLSIQDELDASERVQALRKMPFMQDLADSVDLASIRAEVAAALANLPIEVNPIAAFGGRDLAIAGFFPETVGGKTRWAAYGRTNWMGKLGVALLGYPGLIDLEGQGMTVEEIADPAGIEERIAYLLQGGELSEPLYIHRRADVIIVGTDVELFEQIPALVRTRGQDSFGQSARYADRINTADRDGDEMEIFLDYRALAESKGWTGRWPDVDAEGFRPAFFGRLFQSGAINDVIGTMSFGKVSGLQMHATLSSELLTSVQKKLYRARGLDKDTLIDDMASMVPAEAGLVVMGAGDVGDLLREALKSAESALVDNLEDLVRQVWSYADAHPLIDDLEATFADRFVFFLVDQRYDVYPTDPNAAPNDGKVVASWGLALWVEDEKRMESLRDTVTSNQGAFGIHGREPGTPGVVTYTLPGGWLCYEYWSPLISGTGHIASISAVTTGGPSLVVGNHSRLCGEMMNAHSQRGQGGPKSLADHSTFRTQVAAGLPSSTAVVWLNPGAMDKTWRALSDRWAGDRVVIDWNVERPRIEKKVIKDRMPGAVWGSLTPEQEAELEMLVQPELDAFEMQFRTQHKAKFLREISEQIEAASGFEAVLLQIGLDKAKLDVALRVKYPLGE